jgi:hypothetical protein
LVGKTVDTTTTPGTALYNNGQIYATVAGSHPLVLTRNTDDGAIALFYAATTEVARIGTSGDQGFIHGAGTDVGIFFGSNNLYPYRSTGLNDATIDIGQSGKRFKDLYLSGGIEFGNSTGNPNNTIGNNKLDEYEEGTFSPGILNGWGILNPTYSTNSGFYTRIGNIVHVAFRITLSGGSTNANGLRVQDLPFTVGATTNAGTNLSGWFSTASGNVENVFIGLEANDAQPLFYYKTSNGTSTFLGTDAGTSFSMTFSGSYQVA